MGRREYDQSCSLACALDRIGERWSLLIVRELSLGPLRFTDLVRNVGGAPTDVLTKRLRELEQHGIVRRRALELPATGTAYELTEIGGDLERSLLELGRWGMHFGRVDDIAGLPPSSLANAIRVIVDPPLEGRMTIGLRSGEQDYALRIAEGWTAATRGRAEDADLRIEGEPAAVLSGLIAGGPAAEAIVVAGEREALERLREMIVLPERLRAGAEAYAAANAPVAA